MKKKNKTMSPFSLSISVIKNLTVVHIQSFYQMKPLIFTLLHLFYCKILDIYVFTVYVFLFKCVSLM